MQAFVVCAGKREAVRLRHRPLDKSEIMTNFATMNTTFNIKSPYTYKQMAKKLGLIPHFPRKMKKAMAHIMQYDQPLTTGKRIIFWKTTNGYPYTKWVRKAIAKARYQTEQAVKRIMQEEIERMNQPLPQYERVPEDEDGRIKTPNGKITGFIFRPKKELL